MRKKLSTLLFSAIFLSLILTPTIFADTSTPVSGTAPYWSTLDEFSIRGNTVHVFKTEWSEWSGGIAGLTDGYPIRVVVHGSDVFPPTAGFDFRWYTAKATFADGECTIMTESGPVTGGLEMRLVGKDSGPGTPWTGKWIILKGTGDLNGITGQGTWTATGGIISYTGSVHHTPS